MGTLTLIHALVINTVVIRSVVDVRAVKAKAADGIDAARSRADRLHVAATALRNHRPSTRTALNAGSRVRPATSPPTSPSSTSPSAKARFEV